MKKGLGLFLSLVTLSVGAVSATSLVSCKSEKNVTITLKETSITIKEDEGKTLKYTTSDDNKTKPTWKSSDETVATVSKSGRVTGVKAGTCKITATIGKNTATCDVTVTAVTLTLSETAILLDCDEVGKTEKTLTATASNSGTISWSIEDETLATLETNDADSSIVKVKVNKANKTGETNIVASCGSKTATCKLTVTWNHAPQGHDQLKSDGSEVDACNNPGKWQYWADKAQWSGVDVTATNSYEYTDKDDSGNDRKYPALFGEWENNNGPHAYGIQYFYHDSALKIGSHYHLSIDVLWKDISDDKKSTDKDGNEIDEADITVHKTKNHIKKGEKTTVEAYFKQNDPTDESNKYDCAAISIFPGVQDGDPTIACGKWDLTNIRIEEFTPEKLTAPTAISLADGTDDNAGKQIVTLTGLDSRAYGAKLVFKANTDTTGDSENWEEVTSMNINHSGDAIDVSALEPNTYRVYAIALGRGLYANSVESTAYATLTKTGEVAYDLQQSAENDWTGGAGKYFYFAETGGVSKARYENGQVEMTISTAGGNFWSNQLFYCFASTEGYSHIRAVVEASAEANIQICGVNKTVPANTETTYSDLSILNSKAQFNICFGQNGTGKSNYVGDFTVKELTLIA